MAQRGCTALSRWLDLLRQTSRSMCLLLHNAVGAPIEQGARAGYLTRPERGFERAGACLDGLSEFQRRHSTLSTKKQSPTSLRQATKGSGVSYAFAQQCKLHPGVYSTPRSCSSQLQVGRVCIVHPWRSAELSSSTFFPIAGARERANDCYVYGTEPPRHSGPAQADPGEVQNSIPP